MSKAENNILVADLGGTHSNLALFAHLGDNRFEPVRQKTYASQKVRSFPGLMREFLEESDEVDPKVDRICIDFAGPIGPDRTEALLTNLEFGFKAEEISEATGIERVTLMNDFEAVGYGLEILIANRPDAFVRLSSTGKLPPQTGRKPTAVIIGAGTGLGTSIMVQDSRTGRYRPVSGEGGHADFIAVEEIEFKIAGWIRKHRNHSAENPIDCEKVVSGPGLANVYEALGSLEPQLGDPGTLKKVLASDPYDRPAIIVENAPLDPLCRKTLDIWLGCYARVAKNCAVFPLAPGGIFLAGGIAAKILPELQTGLFMREFHRCDVGNIRPILERTPVFVITEYGISLYGCANVAMSPEQLS